MKNKSMTKMPILLIGFSQISRPGLPGLEPESSNFQNFSDFKAPYEP
jgi:hypothetical protein